MYLASSLFWKSHGHFMMMSFSIRPGDQTDTAESSNLVNERGLAKC